MHLSGLLVFLDVANAQLDAAEVGDAIGRQKN